MRVTASPTPQLAAAGAPDHPAASGSGPFRAALRAAGVAGQPSRPGSRPGGDPADPDAHADDTMAPAAAQVAYLARVAALPGAGDPVRATRRATAPDTLASAAAALALGRLGVPAAAPGDAGAPTTGAAADGSGPHGGAVSGRKTARPHLPEAALDPMTAATLRAAYGLSAAGTPRPAPAPAATAATDAVPSLASHAAAAMTPLEQAIHDLVGRIGVSDPPRGHSARSAHDDAAAGPTALTGLGAPSPAAARDAPATAAPATPAALGASWPRRSGSAPAAPPISAGRTRPRSRRSDRPSRR